VYVSVYVCVSEDVPVYVPVCVPVYVCVPICLCMCLSACVCVCVCVCVAVCVFAHTHTHTHRCVEGFAWVVVFPVAFYGWHKHCACSNACMRVLVRALSDYKAMAIVEYRFLLNI